jgi:hypothetical protein
MDRTRSDGLFFLSGRDRVQHGAINLSFELLFSCRLLRMNAQHLAPIVSRSTKRHRIRYPKQSVPSLISH